MVRLEKVLGRLTAGVPISDATFDSLYDHEFYDLSRTHWTPVSVALEAAGWLVTDPGFRVLDVGSGCGKFCLIGALATRGDFSGVEIRPRLVEEAERVRRLMAADRARFFCAEMQDLDWNVYDGFYFYNPFYENLLDDTRREKQIIDHDIPLGSSRYFDLTRIARRKLEDVRSGTRVATYHGLGAPLPPGWTREKKQAIGSGDLEFWVKR